MTVFFNRQILYKNMDLLFKKCLKTISFESSCNYLYISHILIACICLRFLICVRTEINYIVIKPILIFDNSTNIRHQSIPHLKLQPCSTSFFN